MKLYPHQEQSLIQTEKFNRVAYYLDMGLGKTFVGSEKMMQLGTDLNILVCQKSLIPTWIEHFEKYYSQYEVIDMTVKKSSEYYINNKDTIKKPDIDRYGWEANPYVFVIEFERCEKPKEGGNEKNGT